MLVASHLHVSLGGSPILEDVSLEVPEGQCLGLAGASGSGKSTLLRALAHLIPIERGDLRFAEKTAGELGYPEWRSQVMLVPQRPVMFEGGLLANLERAHGYKHARTTFDRERAEALLSELGLPSLQSGNRAAEELSGGEQQRVQLVRALLTQPKVMLLDEPTSSLDASHVEKVESLLRAFLARGGMLVFASHSQAQLERLADVTLTLRGHSDP